MAEMKRIAYEVPGRNREGKWDLHRAVELQRRLAGMVETEDRLGRIRRLAGADVSYNRGESAMYAAVVVLDARSLEPIETATAVTTVDFPYIPGFLSFREAPAVSEALEQLSSRPDLLMVDGHGLAHPRRCGIASHLGVTLDLPAIGVAKSILVGRSAPPGNRRGDRKPLVHRDEIIGSTLRTRDNVSPVYISIGHRISLKTALKWVLTAGGGYRLPEPTRRAHLAVNVLRAG